MPGILQAAREKTMQSAKNRDKRVLFIIVAPLLRGDKGSSKVGTTVSTASPSLRALGVPVLDVTSLTHVKEVTKKTCQDVPSWISLSVPRYKA